MNKLEQVQTAVKEHFAERSGSYETYVENGEYVEVYIPAPNPHENIAMCILRDLLPLLEASVIWHTQDNDSSFDESVMVCNNLETEVAKLLEEVEL